jgi:2-polyprenyl-3-methyl-5-hydroxy-6-metoxy-1,4-benzoquinol methylase
MENFNKYWQKHKNDYSLSLPKRGIQSRLFLFKKHLQDKKVLHIGCSDWPDTEEKIKNKKLLHQYLTGFTKELYGMDYSQESVEMMLKSGIKNILRGDIYNLSNDKNFIDEKFDVLLVSEVIEHLLNPGLALDSIKKYILKTNPKCEIIFTVPNYHNFFFNFFSGLRGKEIVHPDHKFYFSYRTFRNLLENYGFEIDDFYFVTYGQGINTFKGKILLKTVLPFFQFTAPYLYFKCYVNKESF